MLSVHHHNVLNLQRQHNSQLPVFQVTTPVSYNLAAELTTCTHQVHMSWVMVLVYSDMQSAIGVHRLLTCHLFDYKLHTKWTHLSDVGLGSQTWLAARLPLGCLLRCYGLHCGAPPVSADHTCQSAASAAQCCRAGGYLVPLLALTATCTEVHVAHLSRSNGYYVWHNAGESDKVLQTG